MSGYSFIMSATRSPRRVLIFSSLRVMSRSTHAMAALSLPEFSAIVVGPRHLPHLNPHESIELVCSDSAEGTVRHVILPVLLERSIGVVEVFLVLMPGTLVRVGGVRAPILDGDAK